MAEIAKLGLGIDSGQVKAGTRDLKNLSGAAKRAENSAGGLRKAFAKAAKVIAIGFIAALAGAVLMLKKFITASAEQQQVVAQLEAALRSTGGVVGFTSKELQNMASALQNVTTFGDEVVIGMQSVLLTFTKIGKETFPRASELILDVATRMKTDLKSAALQVGKALNDPIKGLDGLGRAGIQFSPVQRELIKGLAETGRMAEAQTLIMNELQTQFGGAARAARQTLGGALDALKNAFGDLFEIAGPGTENLRLAIEEMVTKISSPEFKEAITKFGTWMIDALVAALTLAEKLIAVFDRLSKALTPIAGKIYDAFARLNANRGVFGSASPVGEGSSFEDVSSFLTGNGSASGGGGVSTVLTTPTTPASLSNAPSANDNFVQGLSNVETQANRTASTIQDTLGGAMKGFFADLRSGVSAIDALKSAFGNLSNQLIEMALNKVITGLLSNLFGSTIPTSSPSLTSFQFARGGVLDAGRIVPFARGGIVNAPTMFPMANGMGLMGEAGPEAVVPLKRGPDGKLGISSSNSNTPRSLQVTIGFDKSVDGFTALIEDEAGRAIANAAPAIISVATKQSVNNIGNGSADGQMRSRFAVRPRAVAR